MKKLVSTLTAILGISTLAAQDVVVKGPKVAVGGICAKRDEALLFCELQRKDDVGKVSFRHEYQYR